jgi:catechol 2,3-dioxygenase-like lactoylglutathione lyase family enzyme
MNNILGLHHMTAICGDAQENIDFYAGLLGLRLIKVTVNFDDPTAYHFYYGDGAGSPGTVLTFFPYPTAQSGRQGAGQVVITSLSIPESSVAYWRERLDGLAVESEDGHALDFDSIFSPPPTSTTHSLSAHVHHQVVALLLVFKLFLGRNLLFDHKYSSANFKNIVHRLGRVQHRFSRNFGLKKVNHQKSIHIFKF